MGQPKPEQPKKKPGRKPQTPDLYTMARDLERSVRDLQSRKEGAVAKFDLQIEETMAKATPEVIKFMKLKQKLEGTAEAAE